MIFISYARVDRLRVAPLAEALVARGYDVWWDKLIEGGAGFAKAIEAKLEAADAVIVVWSATSIGSDWVRDEAAFARDRKRLVPVSLDGSAAPLGFRQYHGVDLSTWRGKADAPEIDSVLRGVAAVGTGVPIAASPVRTAGGVSRRTAMLAGGGLIAAASIGGLVAFKPFGAGKSANSVAVLPFANLSGDAGQAYFSDGLSEEIRSALSRNPQLKVAAPTSSNTFRDKAVDTRTIGSKLGVAFLLEGSVRRAGDVVRIAAELIDTATGFSKWSQSFDRKLTDVFAVQTEIARTVTEALSATIAKEDLTPGGTTDVVAYEAFLKGRELFYNASDEAADRAALAQFDAALIADPNFANAHASRARSLTAIASQYGKVQTLRTTYAEAFSAAQRAVTLAPRLAEGHLALGQSIVSGRLDIAGARTSFDRAYALGRGNADLLLLYAVYCSRSRRQHEADAAVARATMLDPLNPRTYRAGGLIDYMARRYPAAITQFQHALALKTSLSNANFYVGMSNYQLGQHKAALDLVSIEPFSLFKYTGVAIVQHKLNNLAAARQAMDALIAENNSLYQQAQVLAQWGQTDEALATLERARSIGDTGVLILAVDPLVDPLRKTVRFIRLLNNMHFT